MEIQRDSLIDFAKKQRGLHAIHAQVLGLADFGKTACMLNFGESEHRLQIGN
jgi:hypothetical protein